MRAPATRSPAPQPADRAAAPEAEGKSKQAGILNLRPQAVAQQKLKEFIRTSPRVEAQAKREAALRGEAVQRKGPENEEILQGKGAPVQRKGPRENKTGMPDDLKSGIESLSGISMDNVKVHYNSAQPAQLNALAYAQGRDIHIAPGQEHHLPHEAWHVVQQAQGRVQPTMQMKDGVPLNDDAGLEHEADVMGAKAESRNHPDEEHPSTGAQRTAVQRMTARVRRAHNRAPTATEIAAATAAGIANSQRLAGHGRRRHGRQAETPADVQAQQAATDRQAAIDQAIQLKATQGRSPDRGLSQVVQRITEDADIEFDKDAKLVVRGNTDPDNKARPLNRLIAKGAVTPPGDLANGHMVAAMFGGANAGNNIRAWTEAYENIHSGFEKQTRYGDGPVAAPAADEKGKVTVTTTDQNTKFPALATALYDRVRNLLERPNYWKNANVPADAGATVRAGLVGGGVQTAVDAIPTQVQFKYKKDGGGRDVEPAATVGVGDPAAGADQVSVLQGLQQYVLQIVPAGTGAPHKKSPAGVARNALLAEIIS